VISPWWRSAFSSQHPAGLTGMPETAMINHHKPVLACEVTHGK